jgi:predicted DNA-binding antitoxin AbrB/MazE fold protein
MSQTLEATFEDGVFKPLGAMPIPIVQGQRVKVTFEMLSDSEPKQPPSLSTREKFALPVIASDPRTDYQKLNPFIFDPHMAGYRDGLVKQMEPPIEKAMEAIGVPAIFWQWIVKNFNGIRERVVDTEPSTPANKTQNVIRKALAIVGNISSLLIYLVLLMLGLKLLLLWRFPNQNVIDTLAHLVGANIAALALLILGVLVFVRVLFAISDFVKSYRVMTIIGVLAAGKAIVKTSVLLLTATSIRGIWGPLWEFFSGALK